MDYALAISPDLKIDAEEFASVWNHYPESSNVARANVASAAKESYQFIAPEAIHQGLVLLAGIIVSTIALDVIKDVVKDQISKILAARSGSNAHPFEVIVIQPGDRTRIIVNAKA